MAQAHPYRIGFLIFEGFPMACLTSMIEPLRAANEISGSDTFDWALISETQEKICASANVVFEPDAMLDETPDLDCLILLSSPSGAFALPQTPGLLRSLSRHGMMLGAVSGGVFPLSRAQVVGGERVSVHWCYEAAFQQEFPLITASDQVIELSPKFMTASGAAAAFDLSLLLIRGHLGDAIATEVACWFQHPVMRGKDVQQVSPRLNPHPADNDLPAAVREAIMLYTESLESPPSVQEIAESVGITPRHLERSFKKATGQNPSNYFRMLRLNAARQIVLYTNDPIARIASAVGYGSSTPLVRHYVDAFGVRPEEDRARINMFRVEGNSPVPST
ncbi:MAG: GlxA family transcriptional regulator [Paracoccaceae bacterium]